VLARLGVGPSSSMKAGPRANGDCTGRALEVEQQAGSEKVTRLEALAAGVERTFHCH
jgi:hypothetical protein